MSKSCPVIFEEMWYDITKEVRTLEDNMFELMSKIYSEIKQGFADVNGKIETLSKQVVNIENDLKPKVTTALDGYKAVYEKLQELQTEVMEVSKKVETQEVELRVVKSVK